MFNRWCEWGFSQETLLHLGVYKWDPRKRMLGGGGVGGKVALDWYPGSALYPSPREYRHFAYPPGALAGKSRLFCSLFPSEERSLEGGCYRNNSVKQGYKAFYPGDSP